VGRREQARAVGPSGIWSIKACAVPQVKPGRNSRQPASQSHRTRARLGVTLPISSLTPPCPPSTTTLAPPPWPFAVLPQESLLATPPPKSTAATKASHARSSTLPFRNHRSNVWSQAIDKRSLKSAYHHRLSSPPSNTRKRLVRSSSRIPLLLVKSALASACDKATSCPQ